MNPTRTTVRCSSLPLFWKCPSSAFVDPGEVVLNQSSEPAEAGTAFHRWIAAHIRGEDLDQGDLATEHGCDADELKMLCAMGVKALKELRRHFDGCDGPLMVEAEVAADLGDGLRIVGSADLMGRQKRIALILDWKTGRVESDYGHQVRGYAYSGMEKLATKVPLDIDEVVVITVWVREGVWDIDRFTVKQLQGWADELRRRVRNGRGNFNPGGHCAYCPRAAACPGRRTLLRSVIADLSVEGMKVLEWTPETRAALGPQIGEMFGKVRLVEKAAQDFRETLKADIEQHGPISIGGGRQLAIVETNRRVLDPAKARPVLGRYLTPEEIDRATTISPSQCEGLAVAKAPKGQGAGIKREIGAALEAAGAVSINVIHALKETKENAS
jgi:hypothetical protein